MKSCERITVYDINFLMKHIMHMQYQQGLLAQLIGVRNAISLKYAFEINSVSIRTFKGCIVAWFTVLERRI